MALTGFNKYIIVENIYSYIPRLSKSYMDPVLLDTSDQIGKSAFF